MLKALSDMTVSHDKKGFMSLGVFFVFRADDKNQRGQKISKKLIIIKERKNAKKERFLFMQFVCYA